MSASVLDDSESRSTITATAGAVVGSQGEDLLAPPVDDDAKHKQSSTVAKSKAKNIDAGEHKRKHKDATYVGWKQVGGWEESDKLNDEEELLDVSGDTILDSFLPEMVYGDWYHSIAFIAIAGILSFAIGHYGFTLAPVFFVFLFTGLMYRTSSRKYRAGIRELAQREFTVQKIENDYETLEWLNTFLDKFWPVVENNLSTMIVDQVNEQLRTHPSIPSFISAIWIDKFTLGVKPFRVDLVKTFSNTASNIVVMDWGISFTPHDLTDMNAKQFKNYVNQRVVLKLTALGVTIPVKLSNIAFKARTRLRFKLMTPYPHMETMNIQLLEVPDIDFKATILGNDIFNMEILAIPGLHHLIIKMMEKYMAPVLLPPFSIQLNIPQLLSGTGVAIGILEIILKDAKNIKRANKMIDLSVDPFIQVEIRGKVLAKSRIVRDTLNPIWNEVIYIVLGSFAEPLTLSLYDRRDTLKDKLLGRIEHNLTSLHDSKVQRDITSKFLRYSKPVGSLNFDLKFFPTVEARTLPNGVVEELPDLNTGIAKITIEGGTGVGDPAESVTAYVEVHINSNLVLKTANATGLSELTWNSEYQAVITDRRNTRFKLIVKKSNNEKIGVAMQSLNDLIDRTEINKKSVPVKDDDGKFVGDLKITTFWKPVSLDLGSNSIAYTPPLGVIRVFLQKAENVRNLEKFGKVDPYMKVLVNGISKGRSDYKDATLFPVWNQSIYVAITSPNQRVTLECMDMETANRDRTLGKFDVDIQSLFEKDNNDHYETKIDKEARRGRLVHKKGPKGVVTYYVSFYPALPILSLEQVQEFEKLKERKKQIDLRKKVMDEKKMSQEDKEKFEKEKTEVEDLEATFKDKKKMDLDELMEYKAGVLSITTLDGDLPEGGVYLHAFFDASAHSRIVSPKIPTRFIKSGWTGDVMIKELDKSITTLKVTKDKHSNRISESICEVTMPTRELLRNSFYKPSIVNFTGKGNGRVMMQVSWFPIDAPELPESDLMVNTGDLTIITKSAEDLESADVNGYSDPYLKFYMNDERHHIHKTSTKKKTLNPVWNDVAVVPITNRYHDILRVEVMDWDAATSDDAIGLVKIPLRDVKPYETTEMDLPIKGEHKKDGGTLHMEFKFEPKYTVNVNNVSAELSSSGGVTHKHLKTGLKAGTTVVGTGLGTIGKLGKGVLDKANIRRKRDKARAPTEAFEEGEVEY